MNVELVSDSRGMQGKNDRIDGGGRISFIPWVDGDT